jgi:hypothetical protein
MLLVGIRRVVSTALMVEGHHVEIEERASETPRVWTLSQIFLVFAHRASLLVRPVNGQPVHLFYSIDGSSVDGTSWWTCTSSVIQWRFISHFKSSTCLELHFGASSMSPR